MVDLVALKAKLAAQKAATPAVVPSSSTNNVNPESKVSTPSQVSGNVAAVSANTNGDTSPIPTVKAPAKLGTSKTTEIDHLDFLAKMNSLSEAIHKQHPTMPVLLMQIHKQLRNDPELVTTLEDDAIGIIVKGLQVQTKTELVAEVVKKSSSGRSKKNAALDVSML